MPFVVIARWVARDGEEEGVQSALIPLASASRAEPGCLEYRVHTSAIDGRETLLYEHYVDEAAYQAHLDSAHFARYATNVAIPLLESRERSFYRTRDDDEPNRSST
jgi:quinol monooxygenase YgiN